MNADGSHAEAFTEDGKSSSAVWSKDGKSIFFTNYEKGTAQIYRMNLATCEAEQVTDYELGIDNPVISPNERYIAFTAEVYPDLGADAKANIARMEKKDKGLCRRILPTSCSIVIGRAIAMADAVISSFSIHRRRLTGI